MQVDETSSVCWKLIHSLFPSIAARRIRACGIRELHCRFMQCEINYGFGGRPVPHKALSSRVGLHAKLACIAVLAAITTGPVHQSYAQTQSPVAVRAAYI